MLCAFCNSLYFSISFFLKPWLRRTRWFFLPFPAPTLFQFVSRGTPDMDMRPWGIISGIGLFMHLLKRAFHRSTGVQTLPAVGRRWIVKYSGCCSVTLMMVKDQQFLPDLFWGWGLREKSYPSTRHRGTNFLTNGLRECWPYLGWRNYSTKWSPEGNS